ncbi:MAG: WG repeat-containing protein [Saprospiraceae bacterium]|nr:WG repeat-containing protein [Saprospiraceae bacterium]
MKSPLEKQYFEDYEAPKYKWGFLNTKGDIVIDPIYDDVRDAKQDLIAANLEGKWGYINHKGKTVIPFIYQQALDFSESRSFVQDFENQWYLINTTGDSITTLQYSEFKSFKNNHCVVGQADKWGLINQQGDEIVPIIYNKLTQTSYGYLIAQRGEKYGIIDTLNNILLAFNYDKIYTSESEILRLKSNKKYTFYSLSDNSKSKTNFDKAYNFYNDLALVSNNGKSWLINKSYKKVEDLGSLNVSPIGQGFYKYKSNNRYGIINPKGVKITNPEFELVNQYKADRLVFSKNDLFGYLDDKGKTIFPAVFPLAWDFSGTLARVIGPRGVAFINRDGKLIFESPYFEIRDYYNGIARYQSFR